MFPNRALDQGKLVGGTSCHWLPLGCFMFIVEHYLLEMLTSNFFDTFERL